jgi:hypothetical protein
MHKLLQTEQPQIANVQVPGSPFMYIPVNDDGVRDPRLAFQVSEEDRTTLHDGKVGIRMVAYPCPEEILAAVPDLALPFFFVPRKLGEGEWVWEPHVAGTSHPVEVGEA